MGCWGLVVYAATAAVCSGKTHFKIRIQPKKVERELPLPFFFSLKNCLLQLIICLYPAILQKSLDNFDLSIKAIYIVGTLGFSVGQLTVEHTIEDDGTVSCTVMLERLQNLCGFL